VTSGAVKRWHVREWTTVAGEDSATPIRPKSLVAEPANGVSSQSNSQSNGLPTGSSRDNSSQHKMILRLWKAQSTVQQAEKYAEHAKQKVFPALDAIDGHRGAYLLRQAIDGAVEFVVLTLWESMDAVRKFAGVNPEKAVVGPEARAFLTDFDETVTNFEVVARTEGSPK
jgi:heme-degrading monooxygenase HmoA